MIRVVAKETKLDDVRMYPKWLSRLRLVRYAVVYGAWDSKTRGVIVISLPFVPLPLP